jgi:amino acid adenylation domain-containing protein
MVMASLTQNDPGLYHQQLVVRFNQPVGAQTFLYAVQVCFARHAALMAKFEFKGSELFQRILQVEDVTTLPANRIDLSNGLGAREQRLRDFLARDLREPLSLIGDEPIWRSTFVEFGPTDAVWVWSHHHAICDGFSYAIVVPELLAIYDELAAGSKPDAHRHSPDFLDHLAWLETYEWTDEKERWRQRLTAGEAFTSLPKVRRGQTDDIALTDRDLRRAVVKIPEALQGALDSLQVETGHTANTLLLAAWALWLARTTESTSVIFAIMRAGRSSTLAAQSIVGAFVNTVPLRVMVPEHLTVPEWLDAIWSDLGELRSVEHCSLAQVSTWTGFNLGSSSPPCVFNFQRARLDKAVADSGVKPVWSELRLTQKTDIPLTLNAYESPSLEAELVWRPEAVGNGTATAAVEGLTEALTIIACNRDTRLRDLELLSASDRTVLRRAQGCRLALSTVVGHQLIEEQIKRRPLAPAIVDGDGEVTYAELADKAQRVRAKIESIAAAGAVVTVILPPGPPLVAAMLGILQAGCAFFLINRDSPQEEQANMVGRVRATAVILQERVPEKLQGGAESIIDIEEVLSESCATGRAAGRPITGNDLAYVVHTSGSTGEKKFVEVEHLSLANALGQLTSLYQLCPEDRRLGFAAPGPDYFISEVLVTLSAGATLVIPELRPPLSVAQFLQTLRKHRITITGIPASYWQEWVRGMDAGAESDLPPDLKLVITGMEKVSAHALQKWRTIIGSRVRWLNVYGPAETTLIATAYELPADPIDSVSEVPVGRPMANVEVHLIDSALRHVPVGVTAEIGIAGLGVARGYRNDNDATAEKFIPFTDSDVFTRLYRTGDYGYIRDDGVLVFVGRRDLQVKIRGHRVEPGEIEAALESHDHVEQAAVTVHGDDSDRWLAAHVVCMPPVEVSRLRQWLRSRLPPHMQPAVFHVHERLPLLPSGKVDRVQLSSISALPRPNDDRTNENGSAMRSRLARIWTETLANRTAPLEPNGNFFEAGGDSLSAVRLLCRIEEEFNVQLSMQDLFVHSTLDALERAITSGPQPGGYSSLVPLNRDGAGRTLVIAHGWAGSVFEFTAFGKCLEGTRRVYGLQAVECAGRKKLGSIEAMARQYADEIVREIPAGPVDLFGYSLGGMIAYATASELIARNYPVTTLFILDTIPSNLPKKIHRLFLAVYALKRLPGELRRLWRSPLRRWIEAAREGRAKWHFMLANRREALTPERAEAMAKANHYLRLVAEFVPPRVGVPVVLLTPDARPVWIFWRFLTRRPVRVVRVPTGHFDMFGDGNVEKVVALMQAIPSRTGEA